MGQQSVAESVMRDQSQKEKDEKRERQQGERGGGEGLIVSGVEVRYK